MHTLTIPKLNSNDEGCLLHEWLVRCGDTVEPEQAVAVLETSKAAYDMTCDAAGILHVVAVPDREYRVGAVIGYIFESREEREAFIAAEQSPRSTDAPDVASDIARTDAPAADLTITRGARELIELHGLQREDLLKLGRQVIRSSDIESLLGSRHAAVNGGTAQPVDGRSMMEMSRAQRAVADTVSRSHREIPKAFLVMKIYCDQATALLRRTMAREGALIGLPELMVKIVAGLYREFPAFFGTVAGDGMLAIPPAPNVGVTFDTGKGLFIPVIADPRLKPLRLISEQMLAFRMKALRGGFREEDLHGGTITISLNGDRDVILSLPMILPSQTCMLSLTALQEELFLEDDRSVASRSFIHLGLAYDHRAINGHDAARFLAVIKGRLQSPEEME